MASSTPSPAYRSKRDADEESQSSSSGSPARGEYEESDFFAGNNDSQSSIGVPTFKDMSFDEATISPIDRLPAEVLISIFSKLSESHDLLNCMCVSKRWARNAVDLLWHKPNCSTWLKHGAICRTLTLPNPYFAYREFVRRLNLSGLSERVNDGSVIPLSVCTRLERLTLTKCAGISDQGLIGLVQGNKHLLALDISENTQVTEAAMSIVADTCERLQGLNISGCDKISNEALIKIAERCRKIKRLKLNECAQLEDTAVTAFARNCPNILEIDLHQCRMIKDDPITALLTYGQSLRELRLACCDLITDNAFLNLPAQRTYDHLRILDLTSCSRLTDKAVERIIDAAPRLRNLVLAKCRLITDVAVIAISRLGKNLHYVHLGHCGNITDSAVIKLVASCNRIRYIDLGCCVHLTDRSIVKLATLPKLRRIGLVKCSAITDQSVYALAQASHFIHEAHQAALDGKVPSHLLPYTTPHSSLERVHLSYCTNLTLKSILYLLNHCPRLTHLSLTGVQAFLREDLEEFCREAPQEFTEHQRQVFCVFSGPGVVKLRRYLNVEEHARQQRAAEMSEGHALARGGQMEVIDDDQTMTGMMNTTTIHGGDEEEAEPEAEEEELVEHHDPADGIFIMGST